MDINLDIEYVLDMAMELLNIPSPVGYTDDAMERIGVELDELKVPYSLTRKGAILAYLDGEDNNYKKMISAHVDTLGAMVKKIKPNGRLELVNLGGVNWGGVEGENCLVHTLDGDAIEGTIVPVKSSVHIYGDEAREMPRNASTMEIRLDEEVYNKEDAEQLGIRVGDFVSFDPRTVITESGYIKSRFIDDKICIAQVLGYIKYLKDNNLKPKNGLYIYISNYVESTGLGEVCPSPQRAVSLMTCPRVDSVSRSFSVPHPCVILFNISSNLLFPMRQGVHFPQDSSTVKSR